MKKNLKGILRRMKPGGESKGGGRVTSPSAPLAADPTPPSMPPPGQTMLSAPEPLDPPLASPVPEPSAPPIASDPESSPTHDVDPWRRAYEIVQEREPELLADYGKHLTSLQDNAVASADLATPRSVESTVKRLLEDRDKKQLRVSLLGKDIKIREQTEKLVKFFVWVDPVVKNAVSAQPYAALAWSGVSLLLPVGTYTFND